MALDASTLANSLMLPIFGFVNPNSKKEFEAYAEGVVIGLKASTVEVQTTGAAGAPAPETGIGALQGGAVTMLPIVIANSIGVIPPPNGAPTPAQLLWYNSISQIATYVITALEVLAPPTDGVATGLATVLPGGFKVQADAISAAIKLAYVSKGLIPTPLRLQVADVIGKSTQQALQLATMSFPLLKGVVASPPSPAPPGVRLGIIS
jgi:hypothetical protein